MRALVPLLAFLFVACQDALRPRACSVDPALVVWPLEPEYMSEARYIDLLEAWRAASDIERETWRRYAARFVGSGLWFFESGQPLEVIRPSGRDTAVVMVASYGDRFWTSTREIGC